MKWESIYAEQHTFCAHTHIYHILEKTLRVATFVFVWVSVCQQLKWGVLCAILSFFVEMQPRESQATEVKKTFLFETVESITSIHTRMLACTKHTIELKLFATAWSAALNGLPLPLPLLPQRWKSAVFWRFARTQQSASSLAQNLKWLKMDLSAFYNNLHAIRFHLMWLWLWLCSVDWVCMRCRQLSVLCMPGLQCLPLLCCVDCVKLVHRRA